MKKLHRAPYLAAGCITILFLGVLYVWSIFSAHYKENFPDWTIAQLSFNFTLHNAFSCFGAFIGGKLLNKMKGRTVAWMAALLVFAGFFGASLLQYFGGLWLLYLTYGIIAAFGLGLAYITALTIPATWFPDRPGLVSGMLLAFIGAGSLLLSAIVEKLVPMIGFYQSVRAVAIAGAVMILLCSPFIVRPGPNHKLPPARRQLDEGISEDLNSRRMMKTTQFWLFFAWNICISSAGLLVLNRVANMGPYFGFAVVAGMIISLFNSGGRLAFGYIIDRVGRKVSIFANNLLLFVSGVLLLLGAISSRSGLVFIGMMGVGAAFGANLTLRVAGIKELFGTKHAAENFGLCNLCVIPASLIGPYLSGLLQDMENGGYTGTFVMIIALAVIAFVLDLLLRLKARKG